MATPDQYEKHTRIWSGDFFQVMVVQWVTSGPSHRTIPPESDSAAASLAWLLMTMWSFFKAGSTLGCVVENVQPHSYHVPKRICVGPERVRKFGTRKCFSSFHVRLGSQKCEAWRCAEMQNMVNFPSDVLWASGCQNVPPFKPGSAGLSGALSFLGLLLYFLLDIGKVDHGGSEGFGGTIWMFHPFSSHVHGPMDLQWTPNGVDRSGCIWLQASRKVGIPFAFAIFLCLLALSILAKSLSAKQHVLSL